MSQSIPIGVPLPNYQCYVLDEHLQTVAVDQFGELYIGGVGVFLGYLDRDDLTKQVLVDIPEIREKCYKTGDLARMDSIGNIHFIGRTDFQVKLRGQRIEIGEIERTVMISSTNILNCIVIKTTADNQVEHLVAYVQCSATTVDENTIRNYCLPHLPLYMIPSLFLIMDKFPLNSNGKVDRKQLSKLDFGHLLLNKQDIKYFMEPSTKLEEQICDLWRKVLNFERISINTSFFSLGGNSLLLMKLFYFYQTQYNFNNKQISINEFFKQSTIKEHVKLLQKLIDNNRFQIAEQQQPWKSFNINEGETSY